MLTILMAALVQQSASVHVPALPIREFMAACVTSGGDLGWVGPNPGPGEPALRSVYLHDTQKNHVTVSFYNETGVGSGRVVFLWPTASNANREVTQSTSVPESVTVYSTRVRYGVIGTTVPTAVCTRVR
ncbi:hypothetical protein E2493_03435 [Sphingomonas parva]|uniref:Uncharacterized protein n=1 Tax=Sphingomonas parva TaxID=2555898 RepID=A0A4Y8ZWF5_9SPHN|nr:hypothetical protein [Sphingomonas parva]TFI59682.1 hypothetical protein E2493_03435 [Sphingomonas parva]